ncbi:tyrosine-type recombinase/integrase [Mariniflexile rhizosphaerae]
MRLILSSKDLYHLIFEITVIKHPFPFLPQIPHILRHSYATHILEQGIDIWYIQKLLGHTRPEATMTHTPVTRKDLQEIKSPLDKS